MEHTVKKSKNNRIAMRVTAGMFILVAVVRLIYLLVGEGSKSVLVTLLCAGCMAYGIRLLQQTFKQQAYDITYFFGDKTMTLKMHKKEQTISYDEITDLGYVVPNESLDYSLIQIYIGKEQYVLPFAENSNVAKALYGMLELKKQEAEQEKGTT